ncbi:MAG TPA: hypothetical protein VFG11_11650, partial [Acidobacteriota bacterium]|nr:hypothetical protein [Acidobacteriota bacterium]
PQVATEAWRGDDQAASNLGGKVGAEIVIVGQATSTQAQNTIAGSDLISVSSTLTARAVKTGTGEVLAQGSSSGTAAHINNVVALQQSLQKASDDISDTLIGGILEAWQKESSGSRLLAVEVDEVTPSELEQVKTALKSVRGVVDVIVRNFSHGTADIGIQAKTDAQELSDAMSKKSFSGFRLSLEESSADHVSFRVVH